jgi:hypothetical protein
MSVRGEGEVVAAGSDEFVVGIWGEGQHAVVAFDAVIATRFVCRLRRTNRTIAAAAAAAMVANPEVRRVDPGPRAATRGPPRAVPIGDAGIVMIPLAAARAVRDPAGL